MQEKIRQKKSPIYTCILAQRDHGGLECMSKCATWNFQLWQAAISPQNFIFPSGLRRFLDLIFVIHTNITPTALIDIQIFYEILHLKVE